MDLRLLSLQIPILILSIYGSKLDWFLLISYQVRRNWPTLKNYLQYGISLVDQQLLLSFLATLVTLFAASQIWRGVAGLGLSRVSRDGFPTRPLLFPGRTAHSRLFPKKHQFSYPFLMVGVPVGFRGTAGGMISVDEPSIVSKWYSRILTLTPWSAWLTVNGDDYLARGHAKGGLEEKLWDYLKSQGEEPASYPYAYLLTPPRVFGYYSNPVSIWHLYSHSNVLSAMILEVNNTFNERHSYFVKRSTASDSTVLSSAGVDARFRHKWPKDFHVSVFNSRSGSYSISACDPLSPNSKHPGWLDETITLSSSKNHTKLVARVFSTTPALDPAVMTLVEKITFLSKWWWVGFATFPRTVVQAVTILFGVGLSWVTRPEPRRNTLPRDADDDEVLIEGVFQRLVRKAVESCQFPVRLKYSPAGLPSGVEEMIYSPSAQLSESAKEIEIRVLTPLFYSRITGYANLLDGLRREHFENQTIEVVNVEALEEVDFSFHDPHNKRTVLDQAYLLLLRRLRKEQAPIVNAETLRVRNDARLQQHVRGGGEEMGLSNAELDLLVFGDGQSPGQNEEKGRYTRMLLKVFIAERVALGSTFLLDLEVGVIRLAAVIWVARSCI